MEAQIDPWLVLRTRSHHENVVETCLRQKSINAYLPKRRELRRSKNRKTVVETLLFPGYVFVQPSAEQFDNIRHIRGSCGLIFVGDKPAAMPEQQLEAVRILAGSGVDFAVDPKLVPGQRVAVIAGPFMGVQGELVRVKSEDRLVINATLLNASLSVEVDADKVSIL